MSSRIGLSCAFAFANASSPQGYHSTGWWAAPRKYEDRSFARRFSPMCERSARPLCAFGSRRIDRSEAELPKVREVFRIGPVQEAAPHPPLAEARGASEFQTG